MYSTLDRAADPLSIGAIPENLLREPIEFVFADHYRMRVLCEMLRRIAKDPMLESARDYARQVIDYVESDLPLHLADEERDLLPRLKQRSTRADDADALLNVVCGEHERDQALSAPFLPELRRFAEGGEVEDEREFRHAAAIFAETQLRHLAWEDAIILSLARKRLTDEDMRDIGRSMAARRGLQFPENDVESESPSLKS